MPPKITSAGLVTSTTIKLTSNQQRAKVVIDHLQHSIEKFEKSPHTYSANKVLIHIKAFNDLFSSGKYSNHELRELVKNINFKKLEVSAFKHHLTLQYAIGKAKDNIANLTKATPSQFSKILPMRTRIQGIDFPHTRSKEITDIEIHDNMVDDMHPKEAVVSLFDSTYGDYVDDFRFDLRNTPPNKIDSELLSSPDVLLPITLLDPPKNISSSIQPDKEVLLDFIDQAKRLCSKDSGYLSDLKTLEIECHNLPKEKLNTTLQKLTKLYRAKLMEIDIEKYQALKKDRRNTNIKYGIMAAVTVGACIAFPLVGWAVLGVTLGVGFIGVLAVFGTALIAGVSLKVAYSNLTNTNSDSSPSKSFKAEMIKKWGSSFTGKQPEIK